MTHAKLYTTQNTRGRAQNAYKNPTRITGGAVIWLKENSYWIDIAGWCTADEERKVHSPYQRNGGISKWIQSSRRCVWCQETDLNRSPQANTELSTEKIREWQWWRPPWGNQSLQVDSGVGGLVYKVQQQQCWSGVFSSLLRLNSNCCLATTSCCQPQTADGRNREYPRVSSINTRSWNYFLILFQTCTTSVYPA